MGTVYVDLDGCLLGSRMDGVFTWLKGRIGFIPAITIYYMLFWNWTMPVNMALIAELRSMKAQGYRIMICTGRNKGKRLITWLNLRQDWDLFDGAVWTPLYRAKESMRLDGLLIDNNPTNAQMSPWFRLVEFKEGR